MNGQCPALANSYALSPGRAAHAVWGVHLNYSQENVFFIGIPKCGTNTIAHMKGNKRLDVKGNSTYSYEKMDRFGGFRPFPDSTTTFFSIVRDPLERFVSAYHEIHHKKTFGCRIDRTGPCWAKEGLPPMDESRNAQPSSLSAEEDEASSFEGANRTLAARMQRFMALLEFIESHGFFDVHFAPMVYYLQQRKQQSSQSSLSVQAAAAITTLNTGIKKQKKALPPFQQMRENYSIFPVDHLYTLECLPKAVTTLNLSAITESKPQAFKTLNTRLQRLTKSGLRPDDALNLGHLSDSIAIRICRLYQVDYCCLGLPMSRKCSGFVPDCTPRGAPCAMRGDVQQVRNPHPPYTHLCPRRAGKLDFYAAQTARS